jgi:hypothetical protein
MIIYILHHLCLSNDALAQPSLLQYKDTHSLHMKSFTTRDVNKIDPLFHYVVYSSCDRSTNSPIIRFFSPPTHPLQFDLTHLHLNSSARYAQGCYAQEVCKVSAPIGHKPWQCTLRNLSHMLWSLRVYHSSI